MSENEPSAGRRLARFKDPKEVDNYLQHRLNEILEANAGNRRDITLHELNVAQAQLLDELAAIIESATDELESEAESPADAEGRGRMYAAAAHCRAAAVELTGGNDE